MKGMKVASVVVIIAVIIIALVLVSANYGVRPSNQPSSDEQGSVDESLSQGARVDIASPDTTNWQKGGSGTFIIGIGSEAGERKTYYTNLYLEDYHGNQGSAGELASASGWFSYPASSTIEALSSTKADIKFKIPSDAREGLYIFRVVVCSTSDCADIRSQSLYGTINFPLRVV